MFYNVTLLNLLLLITVIYLNTTAFPGQVFLPQRTYTTPPDGALRPSPEAPPNVRRRKKNYTLLCSVCVCVRACVCVCACVRVRVCACARVRACACALVRLCACVLVRLCACVLVCLCACVR